MSFFNQIQNDNITIIKEDGRRFEDVKASVQSDIIIIDNKSLPIEEGDVIIRKLPSNSVEKYKVLDRGFISGPGSMPDHYQVKVEKLSKIKPKGTDKTIYNLGENSRININSNDSSINVINTESNKLFAEIKSTINSEIEDPAEKKRLIEAIEELKKAQNTSSFSKKYAKFMGLAADHAALVPYFYALVQMLVT